jgi:two-component system, OmpR family, sensor histidine kinase KdpD
MDSKISPSHLDRPPKIDSGQITNFPDSNPENSRDSFVFKNSRLTQRIPWETTREMFSNWHGYIWGILSVAVVTFLGRLASTLFSLENVIMFYLLMVVLSAIYWGLGPSIVASVLTVIFLDYFFIPPIMGFIPFRTYDIFTLAVLLIVSVLISYLAARFRLKSEEAQRHEREVSTLYNISRNLSNFTELDSSVRTVLEMSKSILDIDIALFLPDDEKRNTLIPYNLSTSCKTDAYETWIACWSFQNRLMAGHDTGNFPNLKDRYYPLITPRGAVGVMVLKTKEDKSQNLTKEQFRLLQAFSDLIAVSIDNIRLAEEAKKAEVLRAKDKLQTAILNSISHDLRTPLVSVIGVLSSLKDEGMALDDTARKNLIQVAYEDANRLNNFIANLLDISRIESGNVKLLKQPTEIAELVSVALERLDDRIFQRQIKIDLPADLPFIDVDTNLMAQVFVNILDNALKYSPGDSPIEIKARKMGDEIEIRISDHGIGIPPSDLIHVFDKFYRVQRKDNIHGTGLGLSICKGIVESHGGYIKAENLSEGGTVLILSLPVVEQEISGKDEKLE